MSDPEAIEITIPAKKPRARPNASNQSFMKIRAQISQSSRTSSNSNADGLPSDTLIALGSSVSFAKTDSAYFREDYREMSGIRNSISANPSQIVSPTSLALAEAVETTLNSNVLMALDILSLDRFLPSPLSPASPQERSLLSQLQFYQPFSERPDFFTKLKPHFKINYYESQAILLTESSLQTDSHWILEGSCVVTRTLQFINVNGELSEYHSNANLRGTVVDITIDTQELHLGDNTGIDSVCGYGIKANSFVITASVPVEILSILATSQLRLLLESSSSVYNFSKEFLVREYLEQEEYERHRKIAQTLTDGNSLEYLNKGT